MFTKETPSTLREDIQTKMLSAPEYVLASAMEGMMGMAPLTETWPALPAMAIMVKRGNSEAYGKVSEDPLSTESASKPLNNAEHFLMMEQPERFIRY